MYIRDLRPAFLNNIPDCSSANLKYHLPVSNLMYKNYMHDSVVFNLMRN